MLDVTLRAPPVTDISSESVKNMSTVTAPFGRGRDRSDLEQASPIAGGVVVPLPDTFSPSSILDRLCQARVFAPVLEGQTLDAYDVVVAYELRRTLVLGVTSSISPLFVKTSPVETCLRPVLGPFFRPGQLRLSVGQFLVLPGNEGGGAVGMPI